MKPTLRTATGVLVGAALLAWLLPSVDLRGALATAAAAPAAHVAGIVALTWLFLLAKAWRWRVLLNGAPLPQALALRAVVLGSALNYALPQAGELARVALVREASQRPPAALLASIGAERAMDLLAVAALAAIVAIGPTAAVDGLPVARLLLPVALVVAVLTMLVIVRPQAVAGPLLAVARWAGDAPAAFVQRHARDALEGLRPLRSLPVVTAALALSALQWAAMAGCVALSMAAVGLDPDAAAASLALVALVAGLLLPSAPGHAGTTQAAFILALVPLGHQRDAVLAASLVYNVLVVGAVLCAALPLAMSRVRERRGR